MGDIADMMLEGTLCEGCGVYMGDECGFPRMCKGCAKDAREDGLTVRKTGLGGYQATTSEAYKESLKMNCPICKKRIKKAGLADHQRDTHGAKP